MKSESLQCESANCIYNLLQIGGIDITTTRNAYGRQTESFEAEVQLKSQQLINMSTEGKIERAFHKEN